MLGASTCTLTVITHSSSSVGFRGVGPPLAAFTSSQTCSEHLLPKHSSFHTNEGAKQDPWKSPPRHNPAPPLNFTLGIIASGHTVPLETSGLQPEKRGSSVSSGASDASRCTRSCETSETWHVYPPPQPPMSQTESVPIPLKIMYDFCETRRILKKNKTCCLDFKEWHTRRLNISMVSLRWFAPGDFQQSCGLFLQTLLFPFIAVQHLDP